MYTCTLCYELLIMDTINILNYRFIFCYYLLPITLYLTRLIVSKIHYTESYEEGTNSDTAIGKEQLKL